MALITFSELLDLIIMTVAVGFIFMDFFPPPSKKAYDPLQKMSSFNWHALWFAVMITAPSVIFHELAHKFVAISMGLQATFHAAYMWLGIGLVLKLLNTGFIFFVPGYVSTLGATQTQHAVIALAGPALNLVLFCIAWIVIKTTKKLSHKQHLFWSITKRINGFLFVFNMIPIPGFDGSHVLRGILTLF
ncbi:hypothetical protein J4410_07110 [Candidatus Woesearchaeota archaeon]|nr:hypothetical protein [Candidatus Woesearchaeota archaeon]